MPSLSRDVRDIVPELVALRRELHQNPELSYKETATAERVSAFLEGSGLALRRGVAGTGIVAETGSGGRTVLLRVDMDGLPIQERSAAPYTSRVPGVMHACGHDGHMAILMGTVKILAKRRASLPGSVVFLFQPSEEDHPGGAKRMIDEGALDGVDRVFGLHLWQPLPTGVVGLRVGAMMAQADNFEVTVQGRGGHASQPHLTVDPVMAAANVVVAAQTIVSRFADRATSENPLVSR